MSHSFGMIIESLVAVLLLVTIFYCMLLNKRLQRLKADEQSLKATIAELITATEIAERAIGGLKVTVRDCNENLGNQLAAAAEMSVELDSRLSSSDDLVRKLSRIVLAGRSAIDTTGVAASSPQAIVAAAQAFSERKRVSGRAA
jgi:preprotein translocase subunit YajC